MENLKLKVENNAPALISLLEELGIKSPYRTEVYFGSTKYLCIIDGYYYCASGINWERFNSLTEITMSQLKDMVILQRN